MNRWSILGLIALAAALATLVVDCAGGTPAAHTVQVIDRGYTPPRYSTGVVTDAQGRVHLTHDYEGAHWRVIVRDEGDVRAVEVGEAVWACASPGATLTASVRVGRWSGWRYGGSLSVPALAEAP